MRVLLSRVGGAGLSFLVASSVLILGSAGVGMAFADEVPMPAAGAPKETVREEVGKPLQAAQELMKNKRFKEALTKIREAEAVPSRTAYENFIIDRMRASAAVGIGDDALAASSLESVVASGRMAPADQLRYVQAIAVAYYRLKNYGQSASWAARYFKDGGTDPSMRDVLIDSHYLNNDFGAASSELKTLIDDDEKAGRAPSEAHLQLLLSCYQKLGNAAGSSAVLEKLLMSYPKREYWQLAISQLVHRPGYVERLELDRLRLQMAIGDLTRESDFMAMGQLALEAGFPAEAKKVIDLGFSEGILGKGADVERQKRLQSLANQDAADDVKALGQGDAEAQMANSGDALLNTGFNYVLNGRYEHGLSLMEQGLRKGALKHPDDAKLHLGIAYHLAGEKSKAVQTLHSVQGSDGAADLAHLWAIFVGEKS